MKKAPQYNGLVLPGGGARGAYQVGVLKGVASFMPGNECPFDVIAGTSVGAINAVSLASHAHAYKTGVAHAVRLWSHLHAGKVYETGFIASTMTALHWLGSIIFMGLGKYNPVSLLDNRPLEKLLLKELDFDNLAKNIERGVIHAIGVSASSYARGRAVTFFEGHKDIPEWQRKRREGIRADLTVQHLMASASLPFMFSARKIGNEYFGDGSLRLNAPLSPVIHLGADRILVIGIRDKKPDKAEESEKNIRHPSIGSLAGHMLDIAFSDNLDSDIERLSRINKTLSHMSEENRHKTGLKIIDVMQVQPSQDLREIASRYAYELPWTVRMLMRGVGGEDHDWRLPSFLLFEAGFIRELIDLGYHDALAKKDEIIAFLGDS